MLQQASSTNSKLPTEAELSATYGISRQTARRAYQELVADGLVERTAGRGTFASARGPYVRSFGSVEDLMALSEDTTLEVLRPLAKSTRTDFASTLGTTDVFDLAIRRLDGDTPFVHTEIALPEDVGRRLRRTFLARVGAKSTSTIIQLLEDRLGIAIASARQEITTSTASREVAQSLEMRANDAVLRIVRTYKDPTGRDVEIAISSFHPARYTYQLELRRNTGPS